MRTAAILILLSAFGAPLAPGTVAHGQDSPDEGLVETAPATTAKTEEGTSDPAETPDAAAEQQQAAPPWRITDSNSPTGPAGPDVFMLPDDAGKLRTVLGFRYEEFFDIWQRRNDAPGRRPPPLVYESVRVDGKANDATAQLRVELRVLIEAAGWIEIPIRLPNLIVEQLQIDDQTDGECLIYDEQRDGYLVWLKCRRGGRRRIVLKGLAKLSRSAGNPGLQLRLPRAVETSLIVQVPETKADFEVSPGMIITSSGPHKLGSEIRLTGHSDPIRLQWKARNANDSNRALAVEATGQQEVRIERRRAVYDAVLEVDSFGKPIDRLRIRLPDGATITTGSASKDVEIVRPEPTIGTRGQIIEVRSQRPRITPWTLHLSAEQPIEEGEESSCAVGGFEVLGALRQSGTVNLVVDEQLQAYFDLEGNIEQVPALEAKPLAQPNAVAASFQYSRFPWNLIAHVVPRQRRLSVAPRYELNMSPDQVRLNLSLEYQLAGARTFSLRIDMHGWKLTDDPIESGGVVDQNRLVETEQGLLVLPLSSPEATQVRVNLTARRDARIGANTLQLPEPLGAFVTDGLLQVSANPALRLTPINASTEGLTPISADNDLPTPTEETQDAAPAAGTQQLSFRTFLARPVFSAETSMRERQIGVDITTRVNVSEQTAEVLQELVYDVRFATASQLVLRVPEPMRLNDSLTIRLDGQEVEYELGIVTLPRPLQGTFQLDIGYDMPCPELVVGKPTPIAVPLVAPDDPVTRHRATVTAGDPLRVTLSQLAAGEAWTPQGADEANSEGTTDDSMASLQLQTGQTPQSFPLMLTVEDSKTVEMATLERAWLQTWFAGRSRQDRAVFRFRTPHARVLVQLPREVNDATVEVMLDGMVVDFQTTENGQIVVQLATNSQRRRQTLELRYQYPATLSDWGKLKTIPPRLECRSTNVLMYWQLIIPRNWHVSAETPGLTGEYWLGWKDYRWGRQPNLSQSALERLTGASTAPPLPQSTNQYLFRSFEVPGRIDVTAVRQIWLLSAGVIVAFGVGMVLLHTSLAKQGFFWLILAVSLLGIVSSYPEVAVLVVQAIFWGGMMAAAAAILRRVFAPVTGRDVHTPVALTPPSTAATTEAWPPVPSSFAAEPDDVTTSISTGGSAL